jgi:hypothetical protein
LRQKAGTYVAAALAALVLGSAAIFAASLLVWLPRADAFTTFRGWHFHIPAAAYVFQLLPDRLGELWAMYTGQNGLMLTHYPPVTYLVDSAFFARFGVTARAFYLAGLLWWCALVVVTFLLGRETSRSAAGGALVCALFAFNPHVVFHIHAINMDLPQAVMVGVATLLLLKSDHFQRRGMAIAAGLLGGLAILTRPTATIFLACIGAGVFFSGKRYDRTACLNAALAGAASFVCLLAFYLPIWGNLRHDSGNHLWFAWEGLVHHWNITTDGFRRITSGAERLLYVACAVWLVGARDRWTILLGAWVLGGYAVMLFLRADCIEMIFPIYLGLAVVAARTLRWCDWSSVPQILFGVLVAAWVVFGVVQLWHMGPRRAAFYLRGEAGETLATWPDGARRYLLDLQTIEAFPENNGLRAALAGPYRDVPPDRVFLVATSRDETNLLRNLLGVFFGLDRPSTIVEYGYMTHLTEAENRDRLLNETPTEFQSGLAGAELILWPEKPRARADLDRRCAVAPASGECVNVAWLNRCTTREAVHVAFSRSLWYLRPNRDCPEFANP